MNDAWKIGEAVQVEANLDELAVSNSEDDCLSKDSAAMHLQQESYHPATLGGGSSTLSLTATTPSNQIEGDQLQNRTRKAMKFVEQVLDLHMKLSISSRPAEIMTNRGLVRPAAATEDLIRMAERLLATQEEFRAAGKPVTIDLGYHNTRDENVQSIRKHGLLTRSELEAKGIKYTYHGSKWGDGIYTAKEVTRFNGKYGDAGFLVARLNGTERQSRIPVALGDSDHDSITVLSDNSTILKSSYQCLPLIQFAAKIIFKHHPDMNGNKLVHDHHVQLQKIIDAFFQKGTMTPVAEAKAAPIHFFRGNRASNRAGTLELNTSIEVLRYKAPERLVCTDSVFVKESEDEMFKTLTAEDCCVICFAPLRAPVWQIRRKAARLCVCGHVFHLSCIEPALQRGGPQCPQCRKLVAKPQGKMPSGSMSIQRSEELRCQGFNHTGTIIIQYDIPRGKQKQYHPNPGIWHGHAMRTAYLPDTAEGRQLLERLKFAFLHGLTFTVGTSLTSCQSNSVMWSSIHHKTSRRGGAHGFPDPHYIANCNLELDTLHVPAAVTAEEALTDGTDEPEAAGGDRGEAEK